MKPIIFLNIAYMTYYDGISENDKPINGGKWVNENSSAHESHNFSVITFDDNEKKYCLGYVQTKSDKINLKRIHGCKAVNDDYQAEGIIVVWCATPKDGPSAGITMTTAIVSALTDKPVNRFVAMTGEITLRGKVLPIGGLKEKSMGAYKMGIKTIIIPKQNESDLYEIDEVVKENVNIIPVETIDEVLDIAFTLDKTYEKPAVPKAAKSTRKSSKKSEKVDKLPVDIAPADTANIIGVAE